LGGELVAIEGLHQESSAPLSVANIQQQGSASQQTNSRINKLSKTYKFKRFKHYLNKKHINNTHTHTLNNTTANQPNTTTTTQPRAGTHRTNKKKRKGQALNKWSSKQRKAIKKMPPRVYPQAVRVSREGSPPVETK
jgi:hypothetical protein